jgi:hypothetical protein
MNAIVGVGVFLALWLVIIIVRSNQIEHFAQADTSNPLPEAQYSDKTNMTGEDDDPRDIPWIASWSVADRKARRGQDCVKSYIEKGPQSTMIITTPKSCEEGMPHTRAGSRIIIPDSTMFVDRHRIIQHELIHISQRRYTRAWCEFYRKAWSFTLQENPPPGLPSTLKDARRSNPDTWCPKMGGPWSCWRERWWPIPVYDDMNRPSLKNTHTVWWDSYTQSILTDPPEEWTAFFGHPSQDEHPHEISATLIVAGCTSSDAGRRIMTWWRSFPYQ